MNLNDVWYVEDVPRDKKIYTEQRILWQRARRKRMLMQWGLILATTIACLFMLWGHMSQGPTTASEQPMQLHTPGTTIFLPYVPRDPDWVQPPVW